MSGAMGCIISIRRKKASRSEIIEEQDNHKAITFFHEYFVELVPFSHHTTRSVA
jgi:hypothetical protein